jgi:aminopeptidase-like protein
MSHHGIASPPGSFERQARMDRMMRMIQAIHPLPRMINSPGLDRTFDILKAELPEIQIAEFPAGSECEDWIVPKGWSVRNGSMEDAAGSRIASTEESLLFVAPCSEPVDGWFTKEEIARHLRTRPDRPDAFALEHRNAYDYRLQSWGITLPHSRWTGLPEGRYRIRIEVEWHESSMKVAHLLLPGKEAASICICGHIDELCNDDLSGCASALELARGIAALPERRLSYLLLLVPELLGTIFYLDAHRDHVGNMIGMLDLETTGAGEEWCLKRALRPGSKIEAALRQALTARGIPFRTLDFFEGYGNDERVTEWPTMGIPGPSLQRFPFREYHTSEDTPQRVHPEYLLEAVETGEAMVRILERNYVPRYTRRFTPWLTRHGLYHHGGGDPVKANAFNGALLFQIDGERCVLELAERTGLPFFEVLSHLEGFLREGLIEPRPEDGVRYFGGMEGGGGG